MGFAICAKARVVYHPAPKNAGTSMREYLFHIENGRPYLPMILNGKKVELFMLYGVPEAFRPCTQLSGFERFAIIRDPISRFISAYANRILDPRWHDRRHYQLCESLGLDPVPSLERFVEGIDDYRRIPAVSHHTRAQCFFLGDDLSYYHRVFRIEELSDAISYLESRSGVQVPFPSLKSDGPKVSRADIGSALESRIAAICEEDYRLLGMYY